MFKRIVALNPDCFKDFYCIENLLLFAEWYEKQKIQVCDTSSIDIASGRWSHCQTPGMLEEEI